jgi:hypothetical protein
MGGSNASSKPPLSQGDNRILSNLDKYIDVVSCAIKQKKEKSSAASSSNSVLDRINDKRDSGKRGGGGADLVSWCLFVTFNATKV